MTPFNRGRNCEFGAGDSDSCIITMSPQPTSSTTKNQDKGMSPHIAAREAQGACGTLKPASPRSGIQSIYSIY